MPDPMTTPEREGRERVPLDIRITHQTKALERVRDHCSHGVPLYGSPAPECRECEIVWHREGLKHARQSVEFHKRELAKLGVHDA